MNLKQFTYKDLLEQANSLADRNDREGLEIIKKEFKERIVSKKQKEKSPSWGSLMGYYEISTIIESVNE